MNGAMHLTPVTTRYSIGVWKTTRRPFLNSRSDLPTKKPASNICLICGGQMDFAVFDLLPLVNRVTALLKRWIQGTHQGTVHPSHLEYYLDEFTFRFNRRTSRSRGKLFYRLVQQAVAIRPVTGREIRGGRAHLTDPNILGIRESSA